MDLKIATALGMIVITFCINSFSANNQPDDASITLWVNDALSEDAHIASSDINVSTAQGIVTLTGKLSNLVQKQYAELETKKIKGVLGVVNLLSVVVIGPDVEIRQSIRRRIINSAVISSQSVAVNVDKGMVVLSGSVPSFSEKQEASLLAGEVRGVVSVDNNIIVINKSKRSDLEIKSDVDAKLRRDVFLTGLSINSLVENGVVTLTGDVGNAFEKERVEKDVQMISNVTEVKNMLKVAWWEYSTVKTKATVPDDSTLAKSVEEELTMDLRVEKPWVLRVKAKNGHVTLQGTVPTMRQKVLAQQDAMEVIGTAWISNLIAVKGIQRDDLGLYEDVTFAVRSDYALTGDDITMYVNSGTVTILGNVNTAYEKSQAEKDVSGVLGVQNIVDNITISWQPRDIDNAIKERVEQRLARNWATWPLAEKIIVAVRNGTVTLTGQVDSWSQSTEAAEIAFRTIGVRLVDNRLLVKGANYEWEKFRVSAPDVLGVPNSENQWRYYPYNH